MVLGRPHSSSSGNRLSSPRAAAASPGGQLAGGRAVEQCADLPGKDRCTAVGQSSRKAARLAWASLAWATASRWTALVMSCGEASQQSSPGRCSSRTRRGPAPMTGGTKAGSTRANAAITLASSAAKRGCGLEPDRAFAGGQPEQCGQVPGLALHRRPGHAAARGAERGSDAQLSTSRMPSTRAHGDRRPSGLVSAA